MEATLKRAYTDRWTDIMKPKGTFHDTANTLTK